MRAAFYTLGCKLNQFETEALASAFRSRGFFIVSWEDEADLYIINTCTVTSKSEQKARRIIRKTISEHHDGVLLVTGCYVELEEAGLRREFPNIVFVAQHDKASLLSAAETVSLPVTADKIRDHIRGAAASATPFDYSPKDFQFHSRAYLKIQDGCDNRCAYCRVPLARGTSVGINPDSAAAALSELERSGYSEAVITGVNISSYHHGSTSFSGLLRKFLESTQVIRLRISSLEPERFDDELLSILNHPRVRPHFHIPIQSGSDRVLGLMKRKYRTDTVREVFTQLRTVKDAPFIAGDVIVGFPGEGDDDFRQTVELIMELNTAQLHVFQFSGRPGTEAYSMLPKVPEWSAKKRSKELRGISEQMHRLYADAWIDRNVEAVVVSDPIADLSLLTENYLQVDGKNPFGFTVLPGALCRVHIGKKEGKLTGDILSIDRGLN